MDSAGPSSKNKVITKLSDIEINENINHDLYKQLQKDKYLGKGINAIVYQYKNKQNSSQKYAIKTFSISLYDQKFSEMLDNVINEIRLISKLNKIDKEE